MRRVLALMALALLVATSAVYGQAQRGTVEVVVTDGDGSVIPGATVSAQSTETLSRRSVQTDEAGTALLVSLDPADNYVVTVSLEGFQTQRVEQVIVRAGQTQLIEAQLALSELTEELVVTAEAPLVDVTKTQAGQTITLELTESLPTARSYQDYLQLVPGVQDSIDGDGNPASRSGVNYRDIAGDVGRSTDNLYYFDGINTTDRTLGTFGANLNTEIIQEQSVLTGAIPAEFVGVPGLVSNVVTKSGGNEFSGSVNYYLQNDSLVEDNDNFEDESFSTFDAALTLGGPIVRDKAWFFASYRLIEREEDVVSPEGVLLRSPTRESDQGFLKATWAITDSDVISGTFLNDPTDQDGSFTRTRPNSADITLEDGGERYSLGYNRVWGSASFELAGTSHESDVNRFPKNRDPANTVSFQPGANFTSDQETLGGSGTDLVELRGNESFRTSLEYLFDTGWGDHAVKVGYVYGESELFENDQTTGDPPATYISLNAGLVGTPVFLCEVVGTCGDAFSTSDYGISPDEFQNFRGNLSATQQATLLSLWDTNGDGFLADAEIQNNQTFNSTAGNPQGQINYTRDLQVALGEEEKFSETWQAYIQDAWQWQKWSVNAGLRAEQWDFIASNGETISDFPTELGPRVSVSYDINGDGRSSIGVFAGRYFDAFRDTAIDFAGSLTGREIQEQVFVDALGEWVTFRNRGGPAVQDAFFSPDIETPYTDEIQIQYKQDLGQNMMFEINLIDRETSDVAEDWAAVYYDASQYSQFGDLSDPGSYFLGPQYFGFSSLDAIPTNLNFLIGNLPPEAFRDWQGVELVFRKRYADNWQALASYNYADAEGNTNSDGNFDGAGDVFFLDPRAPGRTGVMPGLVEHLFKLHGSYNWDNGFQVGGAYRWNSGVILNRNQGTAFGRSLPDQVDTAFEANGLSERYIQSDAIGFIDGSDYGVLDLRVSYLWGINDRLEADFFLDIFNVLDDQQVIKVEDRLSGGGGFEFLEGTDFVEPRRYFLGARLRF